MTDEFKFHIGDTAVDKILELKDQEPGDKNMHYFSKSMEFMKINLLMI